MLKKSGRGNFSEKIQFRDLVCAGKTVNQSVRGGLNRSEVASGRVLHRVGPEPRRIWNLLAATELELAGSVKGGGKKEEESLEGV